jgi:hypothetical protein
MVKALLKQVLSKRKKGPRCNCLRCSAKSDSTMAYLLSNSTLSSLMRKSAAFGIPKVDEELRNRLNELMGESWKCIDAIMDESCVENGQLATIPGFAVLGAFVGSELKAFSYVPLELWGRSTEDGGVDTLTSLLKSANEGRDQGEEPFQVAVWMTGYFGVEAPVHIVGCDDKGNHSFGLASPQGIFKVKTPFMAEALHLLQARYAPEETKEDDPKAAEKVAFKRTQRYLDAMQYAFMLRSKMKTDTTDFAEAMKSAAEKSDARVAEMRAQLISDATARRKAAVASKNALLEQSAQRARALEKEVQRLASQVRSFAAVATSGTIPEDPSKSPATSNAAPVPAVDEALSDEAELHWRDVAERQAEVIRQLNVAVRHVDATRTGEQPPEAEVLAPRKLSDLATWAAENADRVIVLKRALNSAKKSQYHDEDLVYKALDVLATTYRDVKLGLADREAFKEDCIELRLDFGGSVSEEVSDSYYFLWRGRRVFLDQHVGRGNARDSRFCFRMYFTWDELEEKVIIGWLPTHLPTKSS